MTKLLWLIFAASIAVFIFGKVTDYRVSVGRIQNFELNPDYRDANGHFDPRKFRRTGIMLFVIFAAIGALLSLASPYGLLIPSFAFVYLGLEGWRASRL